VAVSGCAARSRQPLEAASAESEGPKLPIIRREQRQTQAVRDDVYAKAERAIEMYLNGEDGTLTSAKDERFPLPHDAELRAVLGVTPAA
jgi:hypothetical protein